MLDTRIILSGSWIALMLTYLLGDVLRIFSGDYQAGEMSKQLAQFTPPMWTGIAILMVTPIVMVILSLILPQPVNRWSNIIVAVFFSIQPGRSAHLSVRVR
jgi:ABC-type transport system involved in cytochrome c biogenesis permease component